MKIVIRAAVQIAMIALGACSSPNPQSSGVEVRSPSITRPTIAVGAKLPVGTAEPVASILASPESYAGKTVLVAGHVRSACTRKGCWMELASGTEPGPACRVRFKDYSFFVPTDSAGSEARLSGEISLRVLPPEEVAHLEAEGAKLVKDPDGSARAVEIMATGVELRRL